jgi:hypothetical protein
MTLKPITENQKAIQILEQTIKELRLRIQALKALEPENDNGHRPPKFWPGLNGEKREIKYLSRENRGLPKG